MTAFLDLLRRNRNYRYTWFGQIVSEVGDHFNNIAVFSLALKLTGSGRVVSGVLLARGVAMIMAGPLAGVVLDRMDRKRMMILSDSFRALIALCFGLCLVFPTTKLLYLFSALLMFASPFFTSGRAAILPRIATKEELHTANSLTQTTQWTNLAIGMFLGGASVASLGFEWAFVLNALSFVFSAACISQLHVPEGFRPPAEALTEGNVLRPWHEYTEGLRYMRTIPLVFGLALLTIGWASGGGAAQVLFSLFGEKVFNRGAAGIGTLWGCAALGLIVGGIIAHRIGPRLSHRGYLYTIGIVYLVHGSAYCVFSLMENFWIACFWIALSRGAVAISSVLNMTQLLRHVEDGFRGRVFSTFESMSWATMMFSMTAAGFFSDFYSIRAIGFASGVLSGSTALFWFLAMWAGKLPEPSRAGSDPAGVEVHGDTVN
ncbi:MAG: MFS transporter [Bryobacteraceae bacterium]